MIRLENVSKVYASGQIETHALKSVTLTVERGEFIVILGPSGSGKSTLLNLISGLDRPTEGAISIDDLSISAMSENQLTAFRRESLGFIFQQYNLLPTLTVHENVALGHHLGKKRMTVAEMLDLVGLKDHQHKYPYQLSGGEQQRVSIARALVKEPLILFCDEPTGALDETNGKHILSMLQRFNHNFKTTVVLITHNPAIASLADRVIKMNSGIITEIIRNETKQDAMSIHWI